MGCRDTESSFLLLLLAFVIHGALLGGGFPDNGSLESCAAFVREKWKLAGGKVH